MEIDRIELGNGQALVRTGGRWVEAEGVSLRDAAPEGPRPEGAPSLSLGNNCTGGEGEKAPPASRKCYNAKRKEAVRLNVQAAVQQYGLEHCAVFTLTFPEHLHWTSPEDWKEAKARFHSFRTHVLSKVFRGGVGVWEPSPSGRIHLHAVVGCRAVLRGGFNFDAFSAACAEWAATGGGPEFKRLRAIYTATAPDGLRAIWREIRERAPEYKVGRCETIPIKSPEGFAFYVGKYLGKVEGEEWCQDFKGRRLTRWGDFQPGAVMAFSWARRLSGYDHAARGGVVNPVGQSAAFDAPRAEKWAAVERGDVEQRSGFRSLVRELQAQGMWSGATPELLKARLGRGWAWLIMSAYRRELGEAAHDIQAGYLPEHAGPWVAASQVVSRLGLDCIHEAAPEGDGPELGAAATLPEVSRVLAMFGGRVEWCQPATSGSGGPTVTSPWARLPAPA